MRTLPGSTDTPGNALSALRTLTDTSSLRCGAGLEGTGDAKDERARNGGLVVVGVVLIASGCGDGGFGGALARQSARLPTTTLVSPQPVGLPATATTSLSTSTAPVFSGEFTDHNGYTFTVTAKPPTLSQSTANAKPRTKDVRVTGAITIKNTSGRNAPFGLTLVSAS